MLYRRFQFFLLILLLLAVPALADGFTTDYLAIDAAAKSVLLLEVYDEEDDLIATGSGFCAFDRHTLVTNYHVIEDAQYLLAYTDDGDAFLIDSIFAAQEDRDLALLKIYAPDTVIPLPVADTSTLLRAQPVLAIGSPQGYHNSVSTGNISALRTDEGFREIQFTAPISSGSSGGALFNDSGEVIGVTYAILEEGQNLNYAIDMAYATTLYNASSPESAVSFESFWAGDFDFAPEEAVYASDDVSLPVPQWVNLVLEEDGARLSWKEAAGAEAYRIYACDTEIGIYLLVDTIEGTEYLDESFPGSRYYKIRAVFGSELSHFSSPRGLSEE